MLSDNQGRWIGGYEGREEHHRIWDCETVRSEGALLKFCLGIKAGEHRTLCGSKHGGGIAKKERS